MLQVQGDGRGGGDQDEPGEERRKASHNPHLLRFLPPGVLGVEGDGPDDEGEEGGAEQRRRRLVGAPHDGGVLPVDGEGEGAGAGAYEYEVEAGQAGCIGGQFVPVMRGDSGVCRFEVHVYNVHDTANLLRFDVSARIFAGTLLGGRGMRGRGCGWERGGEGAREGGRARGREGGGGERASKREREGGRERERERETVGERRGLGWTEGRRMIGS